MDRRNFVKNTCYGSLFVGLAGVVGCDSQNALNAKSRFQFLTGCDDDKGNHYLGKLTETGEMLYQVQVPQRVHDSCYVPSLSQDVFFARRPGTEIYVLDSSNGDLQHIIKAPKGRHFYGHGFVHQERGLLYVTENDYASGQGVIAAYELGRQVKRVLEFSSYGIGPHQIALLPGTNIAVVANGGLLTHPDAGREVLNPHSMESSLVYIDLQTQRLLDKQIAPNKLMSIRHLDVSPQGEVVIGVQYQGELTEFVPLVGAHKLGQSIDWLQCQPQDMLPLKQYTASVSVSHDGETALVSCPRGNRVLLWDLVEKKLVHHAQIKDVAGLVYLGHQAWLATSGYGQLTQVQQFNNRLQTTNTATLPMRWDNHATLI